MRAKFKNIIEELEWEDPDAILDFHKNNTVYLGEISTTRDLDLLFDFVDFELSFVHVLDKKQHYTRALEYLKGIDILVQKLKDKEHFNIINERYLFAFGMIAYRLKKYDLSKEYFSQLVKLDPDNDNYKDWYYGNYTKIFAKKSNMLFYSGIVIYLLETLSDPFIYINPVIRLWISIVAILLVIIGSAAPHVRTFLLKHNIRYY